MADFERPLANNSRTFNTSSPLYIPSPPLGRVWRRRSSEVGIFHSGDFAEYVSGGFVHFSSGDDIHRVRLGPRRFRRWFTCPPEKLGENERRFLDMVLEASPSAREAYSLLQEFRRCECQPKRGPPC